MGDSCGMGITSLKLFLKKGAGQKLLTGLTTLLGAGGETCAPASPARGEERKWVGEAADTPKVQAVQG